MQTEGLDALLVCGNQYAGFEGAVRYLSDFEIVHRYAMVLLPLDEQPTLLFPSEARWIGDKKKPWIQDHVWADVPGQWVRQRARDRRWKRLGIYGRDHVLAVRDHEALADGGFELVPFDIAFDMARAVKSEEELKEVRDSMAIIERGFQALLEAFEPGKTEAEIMAPAVQRFFEGNAGPRMMNIILSGRNGEAEPHFKVPTDRVVGQDDLLLYSLEITGRAGYWVEFSRALIGGKVSPRTQEMIDFYPDAMEAARLRMREGESAANVHRAAAEIIEKRGFGLGHLTGHSIGLTMIEYPSIGAASNAELRENMVLSFHPQVVTEDGQACLYTQDTFRVGKNEGENLSKVPWKIYRGQE